MDLAFLASMIKLILAWAQENKEGFWQGLFLAGLGVLLYGASKVVGRGKVMAGGVLDTYNRMADDLKRRMDEEREDTTKRINALKEELEEYRTKMAAAENKAMSEHEKSILLLTQMAALRELLARDGETIVIGDDGTVSIKKIGGGL